MIADTGSNRPDDARLLLRIASVIAVGLLAAYVWVVPVVCDEGTTTCRVTSPWGVVDEMPLLVLSAIGLGAATIGAVLSRREGRWQQAKVGIALGATLNAALALWVTLGTRFVT